MTSYHILGHERQAVAISRALYFAERALRGATRHGRPTRWLREAVASLKAARQTHEAYADATDAPPKETP